MVMVLAATVALAQEKGMWRAASSSANSVTGDVTFSPTKILINFGSFPIAQVRALTAAEMGAAFDADTNEGGSGNLYKLSVPAATKFLHKNTLCGGEETQWMATYVAGKQLQIAFFSGDKPPVLTAEAMGNSTDVCGVYMYAR